MSLGYGLSNLGNTCYFNSCIQSIRHTRPIVEYLLNLNIDNVFLSNMIELFYRNPQKKTLIS